MDKTIKNLADNRDIKSLKYIFRDSLDVDPTFLRYEEDYNYCKNIPGLLEEHIELTPFTYEHTKWNEDYWTRLKMDLVKNFSDVRMCHMREVATVFLAEKIQRIIDERAIRSSVPASSNTMPTKTPTSQVEHTASIPSSPKTEQTTTCRLSRKEVQEQQLLEEQRKLEEHNRRVAAQQSYQERRLTQASEYESDNGKFVKKAIGIVVVVVLVAVVLFLFMK